MFLSDNELELINCPGKFSLNCKNYETLCNSCKANNKGKFLKYSPINKSIGIHPASIKQKSLKTSYSRKGKYEEKKFIEKSSNLHSTCASGSVAGDGDAYIDLITHKLRVEIKTRFSKKTSKYPTSKELKEGKTQNISVWYINDYNTKTQIVYMNAKEFHDIFSVVVSDFSKDFLKITNHYVNNYYELHCKDFLFDTLAFELNTETVNRGTKPKDQHKKHIITAIFNPYGSYITLKPTLFNRIIDCYKLIVNRNQYN